MVRRPTKHPEHRGRPRLSRLISRPGSAPLTDVRYPTGNREGACVEGSNHCRRWPLVGDPHSWAECCGFGATVQKRCRDCHAKHGDIGGGPDCHRLDRLDRRNQQQIPEASGLEAVSLAAPRSPRWQPRRPFAGWGLGSALDRPRAPAGPGQDRRSAPDRRPAAECQRRSSSRSHGVSQEAKSR